MLAKDFKEFIELLKKHNIEYLLVGGYAVGLHGYPRYTGDFDIWINSSEDNATKMVEAIKDFGFSSYEITTSDFTNLGNEVQLGYPPIRIDIHTEVDGVTFTECYNNAVQFNIEGLNVNVISIGDLLKNKKASGRHKDLDDLENLTKI